MSCNQENEVTDSNFSSLVKTPLKNKIKNNSPFIMILNLSSPEFSILLWRNPSCFFWVDNFWVGWLGTAKNDVTKSIFSRLDVAKNNDWYKMDRTQK